LRQKALIAYQGRAPQVPDNVFVAPGAYIIGDVTLGEYANIWYNTVLRGDIHPIKVGRYTNIQDNSTVHVMHDFPAVIGDFVTVGHNAVIHGCTVGDNCLIGMGAILLSYCEIGENCIIGAGALVTEHKKIPPNSLVMGSPGRVVRTLTEEEIAAIHQSALNYTQEARVYLEANEMVRNE
jgi:carbonic anhydrase/acetyltransferase-like protein (isoleucine patch superfamily)